MSSNFKLDIPYIAGLFDAKGIVSKRNKVWKIEISMEDINVMELIHETLECGNLRLVVPTIGKKYWRWQCVGKDCLFVAKLLWPHVTVKLHRIEQIIDHYDPGLQDLNDNVVELNRFRK